MRVSTIMTGSSQGTAPPASPVPAPRATKSRPWATAATTHADTSAVVTGKQITPARPPRSTEASLL